MRAPRSKIGALSTQPVHVIDRDRRHALAAFAALVLSACDGDGTSSTASSGSSGNGAPAPGASSPAVT
jgi:hypothetical protein